MCESSPTPPKGVEIDGRSSSGEIIATTTTSPALASNTKSEGEPIAHIRVVRRRRKKRERWTKELSSQLRECNNAAAATAAAQIAPQPSHGHKRIVKRKRMSRLASKHAEDSKSGGIDAILPSLAGVLVLGVVIMAQQGFRGRANTVGIDLGTTNSVVCVQAPAKGVGQIDCIPDPATGSAIIPSVVSFLDNHHLRSFRLTKEEKESIPMMRPHPVDVVVGQRAKDRIDSHPHNTVYHAKRIIGRRYGHEAVSSLDSEVEYEIAENADGVASFAVPYHLPSEESETAGAPGTAVLSPSQIGAYIINHLKMITREYLEHDNIQSAVIAIPAKFEPSQRDATIKAYEQAGLKVTRILEEPTAAALAYGLQKKEDVHYVMVYDFGGGTLDISLLYVGEGGFIDVLGSDGDEQLGGADFDAAVAHWLLEKKGAAEIVRAMADAIATIEDSLVGVDETSNVEDSFEKHCPKLSQVPLCTKSSLHTIGERMKIRLSEHPGETSYEVNEPCYRLPASLGVAPGTANELCEAIIEVSLSMSLGEYDQAVETLYERSLLPISRLLKEQGLGRDEIDEVVMVGGTTRMPQIRELVRKEMAVDKINVSIDPDLTVAYGAASVID